MSASGRTFGVGVATAIWWQAQLQRWGNVAAKPMRGDRTSHRIEAHAALILTTCEARPQLYLRELRDLLREHGVQTSTSGLTRFFIRRGITCKKGPIHAAEQEWPDVKEARLAWFDAQPDLDPERLVFLDETAVATNMMRRHARSRCGGRCRIAVPHGHHKATTVTAALRGSGPFATDLMDSATNGVRFRAYVIDTLVPALKPSDTVILDNLPAHKVTGVRDAIERIGAHFL